MSKIGKWFSSEEVACRCGCGFDRVDKVLVEVLDDVRDHFGKPVTVTSACRCDEHNAKVGGSPNSKHKLGIAADIRVKSISPEKVYTYLDDKYPNKYGIGKYKLFTHIDVRAGNKARW